MDTPFAYNRFITGKNFIGRRDDCSILGNMISQGNHLSIYEPPKSGKMSVIQQALFNMKMKGELFSTVRLSLYNIRAVGDFLCAYGSAILRSIASTPGEYADAISRYLEGTHFVFDQKQYSENDRIVSTNWDIDEKDAVSMLRMPQAIARNRNEAIYLILDEFQNILLMDKGEQILKAMEQMLKGIHSEPRPGCTFIFCGSRVNAMKEIFVVRRYFYRQVEHFPINTANEKEITDYLIKGFLAGGKVVERSLLLSACRLFKNNLWYINHFFSICDTLSRGFIVEATMMDALQTLISIHEPRFKALMDSLTTFQIYLLKAIIDGHSQFSSAEVIRKYNLNSSANVKRLKDALIKKEIVTLNENEEATVLDPLLEYWVKKYFFGYRV